MKTLLWGILILLLWAAVAIASDSSQAIGTPPDGASVNGYFVGLLAPDGNYSEDVVAALVALAEPYALATDGGYSDSIIADGVVISIQGYPSDSAGPIETAPAGDAVDGAFVGMFAPATDVSASVVAGSVTLASAEIEADGVVSVGVVDHVGAVEWVGVSWQNVDWNTELVEVDLSSVFQPDGLFSAGAVVNGVVLANISELSPVGVVSVNEAADGVVLDDRVLSPSGAVSEGVTAKISWPSTYPAAVIRDVISGAMREILRNVL